MVLVWTTLDSQPVLVCPRISCEGHQPDPTLLEAPA
jgi:hypothetical protein